MGSLPQINRQRRIRMRAWRTLAFVVFILSLFPACSSRTPSAEVWLIGLDGADWDVLNPLIDAGKLPNIAALREQSAWGPLLSDEPMLSPILWTSIATGKTPDQHGVTWFMTDAPDGSKIPISSRDRRVRALWNIASEHKLDVDVVGWWATWPAEPVQGSVVSDYLAWHSFGVSGRRVGTFGTTYPEELAQDVSGMIQPADRVDPALIQQMFHLSGPADAKSAENVEYIRQAITTTQGYTDIALRLVEDSRPSLLAIYFEGTDTAEHLFMNYAAPRLPWVSDQDFAAYKDVVAEYWQWQDQQLGRLLAKRGENTTVVVVSDHGFRTGAERLKEQEFKIELADASHLPDGIIMVSGPGVKSGTKLTGADVYDVAPTILQVLGLPVANDFKGESIASAFDETWSAAHPAQFVSTFETGPWNRGKEIVVDPSVGKDMEKMLTSLGYVSSASTSSRPVGHEAVEQKVNMAVVLRKQNRLAEARTMLEAVIKEHPDHVGARTNLARVYVEQNEYASAEKIYRELIREHPTDLAHYEDLGHTLVREKKHREAKDVYEQGLKVDPNWTVGMMGKALALKELGESAPALSLVDRALTKDPSNAEALYSRGLILTKENRGVDAAVAFERTLALDPDHLDAAIALSNVKDKLGDSNGALAAAEAAKQYHPDDARLAAQLGALQLKLGHMRKAVVELERASRTLSNDPVVLGNYGAAQDAVGDIQGASATFERVVKLDPKSPEALATLGQINMRQGRFKEAEELLTRAIHIKPDDAKTQFALGVVYDMTGRLDLAGKQYRTAIDLDDSVGVFYYQLGKVYGRQGKEEQAVNLLEKGRRLDPALPPPGADAGSTESTR